MTHSTVVDGGLAAGRIIPGILFLYRSEEAVSEGG